MLTGIGFALLLIAVSEFAGGIVDWRQGVFWGLAVFTVFTLAPGPAPPELPAMPAAEPAAAGLVGGDGFLHGCGHRASRLWPLGPVVVRRWL
jgi:hypothetical protein